jgi:hypothetical protein
LVYDFGTPDATQWFVDEIIGHRWIGKKVELQVKWSLGDVTWEPYLNVNQLAALDDYLELLGAADWRQLPKKKS